MAGHGSRVLAENETTGFSISLPDQFGQARHTAICAKCLMAEQVMEPYRNMVWGHASPSCSECYKMEGELKKKYAITERVA